jgi:subtilisin family serine protease
MATPFVAGQAALLRSMNQQLTLKEVGLLIGGTADSLDPRNPVYRSQLGQGRIDLLASLEALTANTWPTAENNLFAGCDH